MQIHKYLILIWFYVGQKINIPSISNYQTMEQEIIRLVNEERSRRGLSSLREDWEISRVARIKSSRYDW